MRETAGYFALLRTRSGNGDTQSRQAAAPNRFDLFRQRFGVPLAILLTTAVWFMRTPAGLSPQGQKALSLFVGIFVLYLTEAIPLAVSSLLVVPAAVLMGIAPVGPALSGFAAPSAYLSSPPSSWRRGWSRQNWPSASPT